MCNVEKKRSYDMAIDFDALDLVRSENRSRTYNKKLDALLLEKQSLKELIFEALHDVPEHRRKYYLEKLKKIKKGT